MTEKLDRFTKRARQALTLAKEEAMRLQHREIDTEHLLLGLLAQKDGLAMKALSELGCDSRVIHQRIEDRVSGPQSAYWPWHKPTLAHGAKRVIELAVNVAHQLGHKYIGTEHLLLGIIEEGEGVGEQVLQEFVTVETIIAKITELITSASSVKAQQTPPASHDKTQAKVQTTEKLAEAWSWVERAQLFHLLQSGTIQQWSREEAVQAERTRLARDLHDSVKQQLFSISISAAAARERLDSDAEGAIAALTDVQHSAQAAMVEIDALLHQLSPTPLATIGLLEALREQCEALGYRTGAAVTTTFGTLPPAERLPEGTQEALFRMAQEALSNVARHARASAVQVQLELVADENLLRLEVQDNGQGFTPATRNKGMGLANLQARATKLGGHIELHSLPDQGTRVRIDIPLTTPEAKTQEPSDDKNSP